ncbi:MAG: DegV family protein [Ardenticatenaceae bacterium]|nr:DegV family protein [Ardenticatenaceae bacterium]
MSNVAIVTDSCASIPEQLLASLPIHWVPYYIHCGQDVLRDLVTVKGDNFYRWLATAETLPKTAAPGPGEYFTLYRRLVEQASAANIVSIHMTAKGSAAYQSAEVGAAMLREAHPNVTVAVIDTLNVAMCTGWMVIEAARDAQAGKSLTDIVHRVRQMIPITQMIQTADTLKYLYMGGRIGRATHLVGSLLSIKPLISLEDGVVVALGRARGRKKAYQMMVDLIERTVGYMGKIKIAYTHAAALGEVEKLRELVEQRLICVESLVAELSPALGVHSGPGTAGLCYYPVL